MVGGLRQEGRARLCCGAQVWREACVLRRAQRGMLCSAPFLVSAVFVGEQNRIYLPSPLLLINALPTCPGRLRHANHRHPQHLYYWLLWLLLSLRCNTHDAQCSAPRVTPAPRLALSLTRTYAMRPSPCQGQHANTSRRWRGAWALQRPNDGLKEPHHHPSPPKRWAALAAARIRRPMLRRRAGLG